MYMPMNTTLNSKRKMLQEFFFTLHNKYICMESLLWLTNGQEEANLNAKKWVGAPQGLDYEQLTYKRHLSEREATH